LKSKEVQKFSAWLYVVAKNHCLMELRKRQPSVVRYPKEPAEEPTEDLLSTEQTLIALEEAIDDLKPEQQYCVRMFYLERKTYKDIAETTTYSMNEVKSHIQNGKRNLGLAMKRKAEQ
jgi:RNA polymerase sigma factor (sigma-70 family)